MKIKPEHYSVMREEIAKLVPKFEAHRNLLRRDERVQDIEKRLRWDALYAAGLTRWLCDNVYPYANDEHVDTALRSIMAELTAPTPEPIDEFTGLRPSEKRALYRHNICVTD